MLEFLEQTDLNTKGVLKQNEKATEEKVTEEIAWDGKGNDTLSKIKFIFKTLLKFKPSDDLNAMRISLPAQILDPLSFLEYMHWMDQPDLFLNINLQVDPVSRMLAVFKYAITKDTFITLGPVRKPYNPILGETVRGHFAVENQGKVFQFSEQISHHPPISAFYYCTQDKDMILKGRDSISVKFSGTAIKLQTSKECTSLQLELKKFGEKYFVGRWEGAVTGWLKFSLKIRPQTQVEITCPKSKLKLVYRYVPESMFGNEKFLLEGKLFQWEADVDTKDLLKPSSETDYKSIVHPIVRIQGCWNGKLNFIYDTGRTEQFDATSLSSYELIQKPIEQMETTESKRVWKDVTENINKENFTLANQAKQNIENIQRNIKKQPDFHFEPKLFTMDANGLPNLKEEIELE